MHYDLEDEFHVTAGQTLDRLLKRSKRTSVQIPRTFVRSTKPEHRPPLSTMLRGGRGGEAKLKLYLSLVLLAGGDHVHARHGANTVSDIASVKWAKALAFEDPEGRGARRVADAHNALSKQGLIFVTRTPGSDPVVRLLSADGRGRKWTRPTQPYTSIPLGLWSERWIWQLDGSQLAVLLALLDFLGGRKDPTSWMTPEERELFGFSAETWRTATASLVAHGLVESAFIRAESRDFESRRRRRTYRVCSERLDPTRVDEALLLG